MQYLTKDNKAKNSDSNIQATSESRSRFTIYLLITLVAAMTISGGFIVYKGYHTEWKNRLTNWWSSSDKKDIKSKSDSQQAAHKDRASNAKKTSTKFKNGDKTKEKSK